MFGSKRCYDCGHWFTGERSRWDLPDETIAPCTLNPEWRQTTAKHFCGQYEPYGEVAAPAYANSKAEATGGAWEQMRAQQDRAIKAEKALKATRAELRKLKA